MYVAPDPWWSQAEDGGSFVDITLHLCIVASRMFSTCFFQFIIHFYIFLEPYVPSANVLRI